MGTQNLYWIGLKDIDNSNNPTGYKWLVDNEVASTYVNWGTNQPETTGQDCVAYLHTYSTWGWHDIDCDGIFQIPAYYICQKGKALSNRIF